MKRTNLLIAILIALLPALSVRAQTAASGTTRFAKDGVEFDYPTRWKMTEGEAKDLRFVELATEDKTEQLLIYWHVGPILQCEAEGIRKRFIRQMAERIANQITTTKPTEASWMKAQLGGSSAEQIQLHGLINNTPVTADIHSWPVDRHFVDLIYLGGDNDVAGKAAWDTVRTTLKVGPRPPLGKGNPGEGGVLNGKAIYLAKPAYPWKARASRASGSVEVEVRIDESGNVADACAVSGHPDLRKSAKEAAMHAKFSPTLLSGKPVQVVGWIVYNFATR